MDTNGSVNRRDFMIRAARNVVAPILISGATLATIPKGREKSSKQVSNIKPKTQTQKAEKQRQANQSINSKD